MQRIRKDDEIIVLAGKDKGKQGRIARVLPDGRRVLVSGINLVKKTQKPNPEKNIKGGFIEKEMPLDISNVALYNHKTKKADRVRFEVLEDGKKVRVFKSNNERVDV